MTHILFETWSIADADGIAVVRDGLVAAGLLPGVGDSWVGAPAAGSINGDDLLWRVEFASETAYREWRRAGFWSGTAGHDLAARAVVRESVFYRSGVGRSRMAGRAGTWRSLVFAMTKDSAPGAVADLRAALLRMPDHIADIRAWRLSQVVESTGTRAWSHVWEQEFDDAGPLRGAYLTDPIHWGHVDAWFDVECPEWIVDPRLIHCFADVGDRIRL